MNTAVINIKTEPVLKKQAMTIADELGFSLSSLFNAFLKNLVRTKTVNFSLEDESHPTKFMIDSLKESGCDIKAGRTSPVFSNAKDAIKWLRTNDQA